MIDTEVYEVWMMRTAKALASRIWSVNISWEDLAQEGWLAMCKADESFNGHNGETGRVLWAKAKARWAMLEYLRVHVDSEHEVSKFDMDFDMEDLSFAEPPPVDSARLEAVRKAVNTVLTPKQQEYVYKRFWLGMGHRDVVRTGSSSSTWSDVRYKGAKQRLSKALAHLV